MMIRFYIALLIMIGILVFSFIIIRDEIDIGSKLKKFNTPFFKIPIGILIILSTTLFLFNLVKTLPPTEKLATIGLAFIINYTTIIYLFKKQK